MTTFLVLMLFGLVLVGGFAVFLLETRVGSRAVRIRSELLEHAPDE